MPDTFVIATAGHVDHGKSTLVNALTGMEPDRWAEEKKRGLTIDLGFAWTTLPSGRELAFVDVPGHEKFLSNMLAGLGPAPIACFVIAADKGWQAQSSDHRDAINALGITHGLVVITRADLAPDSVDTTKAQVSAQLRGTTLEAAPIVTVSATTGEGLPALISILDEVTATATAPSTSGRVRLWVDRAFTIKGAGTVVTGTLTAGALTTGDAVELRGETVDRTVGVRGLQSRNSTTSQVVPQARVAVNLRDVPADDLHRGDALLTAGAWPIVDTIDVRRTMGEALDSGVHELMAHIGTAAVPARLRAFDADHARLTLDRPLPLQVSDRIVLRAPGSRNVFAGLLVFDVDPPELTRRGDGARRAQELAERPIEGDILAEAARRGAVERSVLTRFGLGDRRQCHRGASGGHGSRGHEHKRQTIATGSVPRRNGRRPQKHGGICGQRCGKEGGLNSGWRLQTVEHLAQRAQWQQLLPRDPVEFDCEGHARSDAEAREDPGTQAHRRGDLDDAHHVEKSFGPAEVCHECGTADASGRDGGHPGGDAHAGPVGQLCAEAQQR